MDFNSTSQSNKAYTDDEGHFNQSAADNIVSSPSMDASSNLDTGITNDPVELLLEDKQHMPVTMNEVNESEKLNGKPKRDYSKFLQYDRYKSRVGSQSTAPQNFDHQEKDRIQSPPVSDGVSLFNSGSHRASTESEQTTSPRPSSPSKDVLVRDSPCDVAAASPHPRGDTSTEDRISNPDFYVNTIIDEEKTPHPVEITFLDRKTGIEYASDGRIISLPPPLRRSRRPNQTLQADQIELDQIHSEDADRPGQPKKKKKPASTDHSYLTDQGHRPPAPHSNGHPNKGGQFYPRGQPSGSGHLYPRGSGQSCTASQTYPSGLPCRASQTYDDRQQYGFNAGMLSVSSSTVVVTQPGPNTATMTTDFSDRVTESLLVTLCCCCILGLVALHFAHEARRLKQAGWYHEARLKASYACCCNVVGIFLGLMCMPGAAFAVAIVRYGLFT